MRICGIVVEREAAAFDFELANFDIYRGSVVLLLDRFPCGIDTLGLGILRPWLMDILDIDGIDRHFVNIDVRYLRRVLEPSIARKDASPDRYVDVPDGRGDRTKRYVANSEARLNPRERLHQIVRSSFEIHSALIKHHHVRAEPGGVDVVGLVDVANVVCDEVKMRQAERLAGGTIDINDIAFMNDEAIDLEWIDILQRILPSFLAQRRLVFLFRDKLSLVDMDFRIPEADVAYHTTRE